MQLNGQVKGGENKETYNIELFMLFPKAEKTQVHEGISKDEKCKQAI